LLDAVRVDARDDVGYALCRLHWLLRNDTPGSNVHEWWREHRAGCSFRVPPTKSGPRNAARDRLAAGLTAAPASKAQPVLGFFE
jgi:hypothetical protein